MASNSQEEQRDIDLRAALTDKEAVCAVMRRSRKTGGVELRSFDQGAAGGFVCTYNTAGLPTEVVATTPR
jgi:hypothetical protein